MSFDQQTPNTTGLGQVDRSGHRVRVDDKAMINCRADVNQLLPLKYRWAQAVSRIVGGLLLRASAAPNEIGDRTGGLNRAFRYLYVLRRFGKRLKAWNRTVYYVFKWSLFGALAFVLFLR